MEAAGIVQLDSRRRSALEHVPAAHIADERLRMSAVSSGRTRSRSLLGMLNDCSFMIGASPSLPAKEQSLEDIARFLARTPIMPLDGARPVDLTRKLFANQTGPKILKFVTH